MRGLDCTPIVLGRRADAGTGVTLTADWLERHVFVSGATGTGKTAFLLALALQMLDRGRGVLFCTTKHDPALPRALAWAAASRDRLGEFWLFDAMQVAHTYNPTATDNPLLLVRQVLALLPPVPPGSEAAYHPAARGPPRPRAPDAPPGTPRRRGARADRGARQLLRSLPDRRAVAP